VLRELQRNLQALDQPIPPRHRGRQRGPQAVAAAQPTPEKGKRHLWSPDVIPLSDLSQIYLRSIIPPFYMVYSCLTQMSSPKITGSSLELLLDRCRLCPPGSGSCETGSCKSKACSTTGFRDDMSCNESIPTYSNFRNRSFGIKGPYMALPV